MALDLLITSDDVKRRAGGVGMDDYTVDDWNIIFVRVKAKIGGPSDKITAGDWWFDGDQDMAFVAQLAAAAHLASLVQDTPAGTGSQGSWTIGSLSGSNTMAKNNATSDDFWNMTQFGTDYLDLIKSTGKTLYIGRV